MKRVKLFFVLLLTWVDERIPRLFQLYGCTRYCGNVVGPETCAISNEVVTNPDCITAIEQKSA